MDIPGIDNTSSSTRSNSNQVDSGQFMRLLSTQLQNQNPFNPVSDAEFLGQMAQFSSLEESQAQTLALANLTAVLQTSMSLQSLAQASSLIGKEINYLTAETGDEAAGVVTGVKFLNGGIQLEIAGGETVPLGNVTSIRQDDGAAASGDPTPADDPTAAGDPPSSSGDASGDDSDENEAGDGS